MVIRNEVYRGGVVVSAEIIDLDADTFTVEEQGEVVSVRPLTAAERQAQIPEPTAEERLAALEVELRGMRERVAAVEVVSAEAMAIRDAIKPQTAAP
jgi:hypothetical protein